MKIHNQMEEIVLEMVEELFAEENRLNLEKICTCSQCKLDVACYALNRIPPKYIVSGRGLAHMEKDYMDKQQRNADLYTLIHEGIMRVSRAKRPFFNHDDTLPISIPKGPLFNFPIIYGKVFQGKTFLPESGLSVSLLSEGKLVQMINPSWPNPYQVVDNTAGSFTFWPFPFPAEKKKRGFSFELLVEKELYEPVRRFLTLNLEAEEEFSDSFHFDNSLKLEDLYIFPISDEKDPQ